MILDEFLFKLGTLVDSSGVDKMAGGLKKVDEAAQKADKTVQKSTINWKIAWASVAGIAVGIVAGVTKYADMIVGVLDKFADGADAKQKQMLKQSKKQVLELKQQFNKLFVDFKRMLIFDVLPYVLMIIKAIQEWIKNNKELIEKGLKFLKDVLEGIIQVISNLFKFIDQFVGWRNAIMLLVAAFVLLKKQMVFGKAMGALKFLLSPLGLIAAAIGVILLLIDDLMVYMRGGKSYFGTAWDPFIEGAQEVVKFIKIVIASIQEWWDESGPVIMDGLSQLWEYFLIGLEVIKAGFKAIVGFIKRHMDKVKAIFSGAFKAISSIIKIIANVFKLVMAWISGDAEATDDALQAIWEGFLSFLEGLGEMIINLFLLAGAAIYEMFEEKIDGIFEMWDSFKEKVGQVLLILKTKARVALDAVKAVFQSAIDWIVNKFKPIMNLFNGIKSLIGDVNNSLSKTSTLSFNFPSTPNGGNTTNNNVNQKIDIVSNNPPATGKSIKREAQIAFANSGSSFG